MISLSVFDNYIEIIILRSPEELNLQNIPLLKKFYGNVKTHYNPETRILSIRIFNSISDNDFGLILRELLKQEGYFSNNTKRSYYNSMTRWRSYRHIHESDDN